MLSPETIQFLSDIAPGLALGCGVVGAILLTRVLCQVLERIRALEDRLATAAATAAPQRLSIPLEAVDPAVPEPAAKRARSLLHKGLGPEKVASLVGLGTEQVDFLQRVDRYLSEPSEIYAESDEGLKPRDLALAGIQAKTFESERDTNKAT